MLQQNKLRQSLHNSELFKDLDAAVVEQAVDAAQCQIVEQGHYVYRQGENNRRYYIVAGGEVELTMNAADDGQLIVSHIRPEGHFGETSLLTNRPNCINALCPGGQTTFSGSPAANASPGYPTFGAVLPQAL